jgi:hypothetical protein
MINLKFVSPVLHWESPCLTSFKKTAICLEVKDSNGEIIVAMLLTGYVIRKNEPHKAIYTVKVNERTSDGIEVLWEPTKRYEEESEALVYCHRIIEDRMRERIELVSSILSSITEYDPRDLSIMPMIEQLIKDEGGKYYELEDDDLFY